MGKHMLVRPTSQALRVDGESCFEGFYDPRWRLIGYG